MGKLLAMFAVALSAVPVAHAAPALGWHAPAGCPDEAALRAAVAARLDAPLAEVALAVEIEVRATGDGFAARVTAGGETRELASASCDELVGAVAVVIARAAEEVRAAAPVAPPVVVRSEVIRVAAPPGPAEAPTWNAGVRAGALAGTGYAPHVDGGGELALWGSARHLVGELAGARWFARRAPLGDAGVGVDVGLSVLALRAGAELMDGRLRGWFVGELGSQGGSAVGAMAGGGGAGRWAGVGAGVAVHWPIAPHVAVVAGGELVIAVDRVAFVLDAGGPAYQTARFAPQLGAGLELTWH